jgi:hypothetical protein
MSEKDPRPTQKTQPKGRDKKTGKPYPPSEIPIPTREEWLRNVEKVAPPVRRPPKE